MKDLIPNKEYSRSANNCFALNSVYNYLSVSCTCKKMYGADKSTWKDFLPIKALQSAGSLNWVKTELWVFCELRRNNYWRLWTTAHSGTKWPKSESLAKIKNTYISLKKLDARGPYIPEFMKHHWMGQKYNI